MGVLPDWMIERDIKIEPFAPQQTRPGIGVEKLDFMPKLFAPEDLAFMVRLRTAFNPSNRCSPNKMLPTAGACVERAVQILEEHADRRFPGVRFKQRLGLCRD